MAWPASPVYGRTTPLPRKTQSDPFVRQLCATQGLSYQRALRVRERWTGCAALCDALRGPDAADVLAELGRLMGSPCVARRLREDLIGEAAEPVAAVGVVRRTAAPRRATTAPVKRKRKTPPSLQQPVVLVGEERGDEDIRGGESEQQPDHAGLSATTAELGGEGCHASHRHEEDDDLACDAAPAAPRV